MISTSIQPPANPARQPRNKPSPSAIATDRSPTSKATTTSPAKARRLRRKRCQASAESVAGVAGRATIKPAPTAMLALPRDPRVQRPVGEVHREVDDHEGEGEDEHRALEQHVVAGEDCLDHEASEPGPGEDGLGEHGAAHELAGLQAQ